MSLSVEFFYKDPPNGCFSPQYPIIGGTGTNSKNLSEAYLRIKFLKKLDKVDTINITFSGEINITFEHYYILELYYTPEELNRILKVRKYTETKVEILTEKLSLFNFTQTLFDNPNSTFEKDEEIILKINELKFPFDKFDLPSSYEFSSPTWHLSVNYGLTVDLQRPKSFLNKHYEKYFKLDYQSGNYFNLDRNLNYLDSNISLKDRDSHCFKKKPRRFILDEGTNLVESPLNGSHRHTRIIRSMFSDSYKKSNYKNLTKDVDLVLEFKPDSFIDNLKNSFDITDNFISQLGVLRIETNSVVNNSLVPDYVINNKSTELGKFHFKYLKIYMIDNLNVRCKAYNSGSLQKKTLIDTIVYKRQDETVSPQFINGYNNTDDLNDAKSNNYSMNTTDTLKTDSDDKDTSISFDVCNFKQDPEREGCYFTEFNIGELLNNSSSSVSFPKPILSSFNMPKYFENDVSIEIEIGIDSRFKGEESTKIYNLNFGVILTNNSRLPQQVNQKNQYSGEKYNNDDVTATSEKNSQDQYINNNSYNNANDVVLNQAPSLDPIAPLSPTENSFQKGVFQQRQQYQAYSPPVYPQNTSLTAASGTSNSNTSYYNDLKSQLSQKYQRYQTGVNQVRTNNNRLNVPQSRPLSNSSSTGMTYGYFNTDDEEDLPPPQYNEIFDSYGIGNESSNHSASHVANK
ncbi:hypothetical protein BVG19_g2323 [[Candida] boidinii]|nr:hypothetical protein BVG19_g2323 [[Candida] boidinii]OWB48905.1 hypothetical protein B5S27_g442 [[Candida] boidinii]OWB82201.1 hypothetical protein B5S33_g823 [[Candida] boidinii]